eukprot:TRINITY_DN183_c0_g1_i1.p2 TRINITY_DN183_c0_g1~~TRINITY_DN183_c0_g1_i1.p2  ORF type:complete len:365 (+),score=154.43 TRINITY_DN183_c0_g1_i1:64-1158(+)
MRSFLLCAMVPLCTAFVTTTWRDLQTQEYSFKHYITEYKKSYVADEYMRRQAIFDANLAKIRQHNSEEHSWKMGLNEYADWTEQEFKKVSRGLRGDAPASLKAAPVSHKSVSDLPASVDWREKNVVTAVKNQAMCGSCWAFSAVESIESHTAIATGKLLKLSEQQIVSCMANPQECGGTGGCKGATQGLAFNYTKQVGLSLEEDYPYTSSTGITWSCKENKIKPAVTVSGFVELQTNNYTAMVNALANVGPVSVSAAASPWQLYESGVFSSTKCGYEVDHGIQMVGYGAEGSTLYWIVRNSWGPSWGESGYIRLLRKGEGSEDCGMDTKPQDGLACKGDTDPIKYCGQCGILSYSTYPTGAHTL